MDNDSKNTKDPDPPTIPVQEGSPYNQYIDPNYQQKKKKKQKLIIFGAVLAVIAVVVAAVILALSLSSGQDNSTAKPVDVVKACDDKQCFDENFLLCQPARYESIEENSTVVYEISGIQEVGCLVSLKYINSEEQELIGKEMTCDLDNEVAFDESLSLAKEYSNDYECEGELKDYL